MQQQVPEVFPLVFLLLGHIFQNDLVPGSMNCSIIPVAPISGMIRINISSITQFPATTTSLSRLMLILQ
jgi:hypothetical protein